MTDLHHISRERSSLSRATTAGRAPVTRRASGDFLPPGARAVEGFTALHRFWDRVALACVVAALVALPIAVLSASPKLAWACVMVLALAGFSNWRADRAALCANAVSVSE